MHRKFPKGHPDNWSEFRSHIFDRHGSQRVKDIYNGCKIPTSCFYSVFFDVGDPEIFGLMRSGWPIEIPGDKISSFLLLEELAKNPKYDISQISDNETLPNILKEILAEINLNQGVADVEMLDLAEPVRSEVFGPLSYNDLSRLIFIGFAKFLDLHFLNSFLSHLSYLNEFYITVQSQEINTEPTDYATIKLKLSLEFNKESIKTFVPSKSHDWKKTLEIFFSQIIYQIESSFGLLPFENKPVSVNIVGGKKDIIKINIFQEYQVGVNW